MDRDGSKFVLRSNLEDYEAERQSAADRLEEKREETTRWCLLTGQMMASAGNNKYF